MIEKLREHHRVINYRERLSHAARTNGFIHLDNIGDSQYVGSIGVGTIFNGNDYKSQSKIKVVFDTGSTNLWIASTLCSTSDCQSRAQYDSSSSSTYQRPDQEEFLDITFGTGELRGPMGADDFHVGGFSVQNQSFALIAEEVGSVFSTIRFEGILGLAFPSMSAKHVTPFFDNIIQQRVLKKNEFSFFFTKLPDTHSAIFFGGVDDRFYQKPIIMFPVTEPHYWTVKLLDMKLGNQTLNVNEDGTKIDKLIVDTGTTYFTAPSGILNTILDAVPAGRCRDVSNYPPLVYTLQDENMQRHEIHLSPTEYMVTSDSDSDAHCEPAFMEINVPGKHGPAFLFGEVLMRSYFTVFDRQDGNDKAFIGLAKAKWNPEAMADLKVSNFE